MKRIRTFSPALTSFIQAGATIIYCSIVAFIMWNGERLFGPVKNYLGPVLFLGLFVVSALICSLLVFGYPLLTYFETKDINKPFKIVIYTAGWLAGLVFGLFLILTIF